MAFESKNTKIDQAVKETIEEKKETAVAESDFLSNISAIEKEKKKQFQFTLKPSNRSKLTEIARQKGFTSDSAFLDTMIEQL